jgi:hypothetical protein
MLKICRHRLIVDVQINVLERFDAVQHDLAVAAFVALGLHNFLELVARTADGEALIVEQIADAADHQHFMVLVVAAVPAPFHRAQLRELLLPITEHVRFHAAQITHFTNGEIALGGNRRKSFLQGNQCTVEESYEFTLRLLQLQTIKRHFLKIPAYGNAASRPGFAL